MDYGFKKSGAYTLLKPLFTAGGAMENLFYFSWLESHLKAVRVLNKATETDLKDQENPPLQSLHEANELYEVNIENELKRVLGLIQKKTKKK